MICGSQLYKTDIDGWLDFIFLNAKIDLIMCIDCLSKGSIWHFKWKKMELISKFFSYNSLLFCIPLYSLDKSFICHKSKWSMAEYMIAMNMPWVWRICVDSESQQPFPWKLSLMMKRSLLSVQIVIKNTEEKIQNGGTQVQQSRIKCEFVKNDLCRFSRDWSKTFKTS